MDYELFKSIIEIAFFGVAAAAIVLSIIKRKKNKKE